jgi:DNA-binding NarL/FixJ family response regulator
VLIVDDHELVAEALQRTLSAEADLDVIGHALTVAAAIAAAREQRPDVILMDFALPDGHGTEAAAIIKRELPDTEIVMLTGQADCGVLAAALESGCSGFVTKDGSLRDLASAIRGVLAGEVRVPQKLIGQLAAYLRPRPAATGSDLTRRELEVLRMLADGRSTSAIVDELVLSVHTVRNHIRNILAKLNAQSRLEAVAIATRQGLLASPLQQGAS